MEEWKGEGRGGGEGREERAKGDEGWCPLSLPACITVLFPVPFDSASDLWPSGSNPRDGHSNMLHSHSCYPGRGGVATHSFV